MRRTTILLGLTAILVATIISACGGITVPTPTPIPVNETALNQVSWLTEPLQITQNDFTIELVRVVQDGNELVATVKYPLRDWRTWYINLITLDIGHEFSFSNPGARLNERLYQKGINTFCLQRAVDFYEEKCISSTSMEPYETVDLIFTGVPEVEDGTQIDLIIRSWSTELRKSTFCNDFPLRYIEETVAQTFPGLTLECTDEEVNIAEDSGYVNNLEAWEAVSTLVAFAGEGKITGWFEFEFNKQTQ